MLFDVSHNFLEMVLLRAGRGQEQISDQSLLGEVQHYRIEFSIPPKHLSINNKDIFGILPILCSWSKPRLTSPVE
jgi:hypothetical protein